MNSKLIDKVKIKKLAFGASFIMALDGIIKSYWNIIKRKFMFVWNGRQL